MLYDQLFLAQCKTKSSRYVYSRKSYDPKRERSDHALAIRWRMCQAMKWNVRGDYSLFGVSS